jgi:predicted RNA methylase
MTTGIFIRKLKRIRSVYQDMGLRGVASRLRRRAYQLVGRDDPEHARWLSQKIAVDTAYDSAKGIQTGGVQEIFDFQIVGENAQHGLSHIASDPQQVRTMIARLDINVSEHTFVDLGSGKGRALMLAAEFPFRRLIGVEFAKELYTAAQANFASLAATQGADARVELVCGDAAAFAFPIEPLVIYLFNPFGSAIVRVVARNALASYRAAPRPMTVIYMNPLHLADFVDTGWQLRSRDHGYAHLTPSLA